MSFKNPTGYWSHQGSYFVLLTDETDISSLPNGVAAFPQSKTVYVSEGRIKQVTGGIQFYADEQPFSWGYKFIKEIQDGTGKTIWRNRNYQKNCD